MNLSDLFFEGHARNKLSGAGGRLILAYGWVLREHGQANDQKDDQGDYFRDLLQSAFFHMVTIST
jgi:hypothetical protein